jgi:hydrogenase expression/formation protein HypC
MCLAVPGKIISICDHEDSLMRTGKVSFGGVIKEVSLAYVPEAKIDDYAIVHVGFALSILDPQEAEHTLNYLHQIEVLALPELQPGDKR